MATFAKSLGNGHPVAAVIGTKEAMEGAHDSFVSSTYWTERVGPVAAIAVLKKMQEIDVPAHVDRMGLLVADMWRKHFKALSLPCSIEDYYPCLTGFTFDHELAGELRLLLIQEMLKQGFLAPNKLYLTLAHNEENLAEYDNAIGQAFAVIAQALEKDDVKDRLNGPLAYTTFRRLL
jgi:glutamate-1-semialdehyde aminotransferase